LGLPGVGGIEFDVDLTSDRLLVVHHRGKNEPPVVRTSYARLRENNRGKQIPLFEEVLNSLAGILAALGPGVQVLLDVEIKRDPETGFEEYGPEYAGAVLGLLERHLSPSVYAVTSFDGSLLRQVRALNPGLALGILYENNPILAASLVRDVEELRPGFLAPNHALVAQGSAQRPLFENAGLPLFLWTVDNRDLDRFLADPLPAALITDQPGQALLKLTP